MSASDLPLFAALPESALPAAVLCGPACPVPSRALTVALAVAADGSLWVRVAAAPWRRVSSPLPHPADLDEWAFQYDCPATDGCTCPVDGLCAHGHPSWLLVLGRV